MAEITTIAQQFVQFYYSTFDSDRSNLSSLYRPGSMLTWEGTPIQSAASIIEKLTSLPFSKVQHKVETLDAQPSSPTTPSIIVAVTGLLQVDDSPNPLQFSQTFHLIPDGGSYYVQNDIFRLNYGA
ncbi:nuclear transport factor 2 [Lentinula edodes]|uniref:Nuclear transport factor 2 n=2 Tax=Lentinula TaxID=5352 RepID=A0A1Q3E5M7_LENED|nr:nuclear transport factor 2 [Lentinula edodes]KAJ3868653.1 nuclear transport factor 2 [Lentinula novae-zelandiae]KAJ3928524.1 MAG: nuclear transport factor 2 [Lentinula lateritia]KAH7869629.1 nuclear transport factor 2 [Lentinula edodes]KAJ3877135.1 nuclear transport factor 2 [Lentinula edodes]KAJ3890352.1 nuclear transport factor 2 [Lentinula edodes]